MDVHLEREAAEDYAQSDLEPNSLGHFSLDFLTQSSDVRDCAGICVAKVFSQQFVGLERNSELLLQDMQQHKVDLKWTRRSQIIRIGAFLLSDRNWK